ncbi:S8 family serine peptidase, partial [Clostridium grantii]
GIIAASMNEFGVVGMVPDADIYAIKALDSNGDGYVSDIIEGIDWAIKNHLDILNLSISTVNNSESFHDIVKKANETGMIMVAAAGNNYGGSSEFPAAYPEVLSVGAIDENGSIADFSALEGVDVYAPGSDIYSTFINGRYESMSGTSMAVPHVVGLKCLKAIN